MLFNSGEFCPNRHREGQTFLMGVNEIAFTRVLHFENEESRGK